MTNRNDIDELLDTLEKIRSRKYPDIPKELIENIVRTEYDELDNDALRAKHVRKLIDDYLGTITEA